MRIEDRIVLIRKLEKRDGPGCFYCHVELTPDRITLDHYFPKSLGGKNEPENLRIACQRCNNRKGSLVPDGKRHPVPAPRPPRRTREQKRAMKALRGVICGLCYDGRINNSTCTDCGKDPFPPERSHNTKVKAYECAHDGITWCWWCTVHVDRQLVSA